MVFLSIYKCGGTMSRHKNIIDYAPSTPKIPLGSETPKEYLSLALYLTLPVSKSPSIAVVNGALLEHFHTIRHVCNDIECIRVS